MQACDKVKEDIVTSVIVPENNRNLIFHCNAAGAAFELTQLFREGTDATITVVSQPKLGKIEPIGDKIMRYLPDTTTLRGLDSFVIAIKNDGKTIKRTVFLNTTDVIPCSEQAVGNIFNVAKVDFNGQSFLLNIISNDKPCTGFIDAKSKAIESVPTRGSVNFLGNQFGSSTFDNENSVNYFPTLGFVGTSFFTYKVKNSISDKHFYYANVKVNSVNTPGCNTKAVNDNIFWQRKSDNDLLYTIDVTENDKTCTYENFNQTFSQLLVVGISKQPLHGIVSKIVGKNIYYELTDKNATSDELEYTLKGDNGQISKAKLTLNIRKPSDCKTILAQDYVQFSLALRSTLSYPVTDNDLICGELKEIKIISPPSIGTAEIKNNEIVYTPAPNIQGKVRIVYEVKTDKGERLQSDLIIDVSL